MSILGLIDQSIADQPEGGIEAPSATFGDVFDASISATARTQTIHSGVVFKNMEMADRDRKYKQITGRDIYEDAFTGAPNFAELEQARISRRNKELVNGAVDNYLARAKAEDPEKFKDIQTSVGVEESVKAKAKAAIERQAKATAGATGFSAVVGNLAGGVVAGFTDPINLATIPLGAGVGAGLLKTMLIEAGANVAGEAIAYPAIKKWQEELGQEYGAKDLATNMGFGALFGAGMGGLTKGIQVGLEKIEVANYAKLAKMREKLEEVRRESVSREQMQETLKTAVPADEVIAALSAEERRLHIESADPARVNPDIPPDVHPKALAEVDAALNEGRPVQNIPVTDEQMKSVVPKEFKAKPQHRAVFPGGLGREEFDASAETLFHGTDRMFEKFEQQPKSNKWRNNTGGVFFTAKKDVANTFAWGNRGGQELITVDDDISEGLAGYLDQLLGYDDPDEISLTPGIMKQIAEAESKNGRNVFYYDRDGEYKKWTPEVDVKEMFGVKVFRKGHEPRIIEARVFGKTFDAKDPKNFPDDLLDRMLKFGNRDDHALADIIKNYKDDPRGYNYQMGGNYQIIPNARVFQAWIKENGFGKIKMADAYESGFESIYVPDVRFIEHGGESPHAMSVNELLSTPKVEPKTMEQYDEIMEMYESPEARTQEKLDFAEKFSDPDEIIYLDDKMMTVKDLQEMFKEDKEYFSAISSCGLPKGDT